MSSPIYTRLNLKLPMTWNPDEFWVAFEIREYLGDSYDDGNGVVEYMGEANYGEHGSLGQWIKILIELRIPFVMTQEPDLESMGTLTSFDGFQRLDAEWANEVVLTSWEYQRIKMGQHPWAGSVPHYFTVADNFRAEELNTEHLGQLVPPDPRTRRNVLIVDAGPSHPEHV